MAKILVIHGPNLNLLGTREPQHYGAESLADINQRLPERANSAGHQLRVLQANSEGALIDEIHAAREDIEFIIINPAGYTHTSIALPIFLTSLAASSPDSVHTVTAWHWTPHSLALDPLPNLPWTFEKSRS